jgi:DNA-binding transcriptional MerR regulator
MLQIPESTTRLYLRRYQAFIPYTGEGRRRRYRPETLDVLKFVVELSQAGVTPDAIHERLADRFPIDSKIQQVQQQQILQHQQSVADASQMLSRLVADEIGPYLAAILDEVMDLRQEVADLRRQLDMQQAKAEPQELQQEQQPPTAIDPSPVTLSEARQPEAEPQRPQQEPQPALPARPWWQFWK